MMEMKTLSLFIILLVTLAHVDARFVEPTLTNQGNMASYMEVQPQDSMHEENLCKSTGQCLGKSSFPSKNAITSTPKTLPEEDECVECLSAVKHIFAGMQTPRMMKKMKRAIFDYCEERESEKHCEITIQKYVPMIMLELEKLKSEELCRMLGFCGAAISI